MITQADFDKLRDALLSGVQRIITEEPDETRRAARITRLVEESVAFIVARSMVQDVEPELRRALGLVDR